MASKQQKFISIVAPLAQAEYKRRGKAKAILPSVCIAQAAVESGWNVNAKTVFGIKGSGVSLPTKEYINGGYVDVVDSFKSYPDISASVVGYYDFIANTKRYCKCINNDNYEDVIYNLQHTTDGLSYATSPTYEATLKKIIKQYNLTQYDKVETSTTQTNRLSNEEIAKLVIRGSYGNGEYRKYKLESEGYDYKVIQAIVNKMLKGR